MYQQPKAVYDSNDSVRRLSSNNPFRSSLNGPESDAVPIPQKPRKSSVVRSPNTQFNDWVQKNKKLIDYSDEEPDDNFNLISSYGNHSTEELSQSRVTSDSSRVSSNNPFASALGSYSHHRDPPPVPKPATKNPPARPPKTTAPPPPSYEEAAGKEAARREYSREKSGSSSTSRSRPHTHRSNSDSSRHYESSRYKGSGREREKEREKEKERERRRRHKAKKAAKPEPVKSKNLDTIDRLDVSAFFGGGFHHDGPYDALTNHRNKNVKAAPVKAFPIDGPNNSLKGNIDIGTNEQMNMAFGYADQNEIVGRKSSVRRNLTSKSSDDLLLKTNRANDLTSSVYTPKSNPSVINFDVNVKAEPVHGSVTAGLGSTTFVDGAPAPKTVQDEYLAPSSGGLGRKKSLVQRLRGNSGSDHNTRRSSNDNMDRVKTNVSEDEPTGNSLLRRVKSLKVSRRERS